jgi:hypothetical protein
MLYSNAAQAQDYKNKKISEMILILQKSIIPALMEKEWKNNFSIWKISLGKADASLDELKKSILFLDKHINIDAYKTIHKTRVEDWHIYLTSANSIKTVYSILIEINNSLDNTSRTREWISEETKWLTEIQRRIKS